MKIATQKIDSKTDAGAVPKVTMTQVTEAVRVLRSFIGPVQLEILGDACRGEEREFFKAKLLELAEIVEHMPKSYEQESKGDQAVAHLHYFTGAWDWYITERDAGSDDDGQDACETQVFGLVCGFEEEIGYISLEEITRAGAELDLYFKPKTLKELRAAHSREESPGP